MTMDKSDAELAYPHLPERVRGDVEYEAYDSVLSTWRDERPDDLDELEAAHERDDSPFAWDRIELTIERSQVDGSGELVPHTMTDGASDEIHELARDFGWDYVAAVRDEVRALQESTNFSPREFVAFVLSESHLSWEEAASEMSISSGTFASKMQREVRPEIESARETVALVEQFDSDD